MKKIFGLIIALVFMGSTYAQNGQYKFQEPTNYIGVKNTGSNMTVGLPETCWDVIPQVGDEIAAFNSIGQLVGSTVFLGGNSAITIWGDDETTMEKEGVADNSRFTLRIWNSATGQESSIEVAEWLQGNDVYATNAISVIGKLKVTSPNISAESFQIMQNMPNPAVASTQIEFYIPYAAQVKFNVFSQDGKLVKDTQILDLPAGKHLIELNVQDLAAGTYFYKIQTEEFSGMKSMTVVK